MMFSILVLILIVYSNAARSQQLPVFIATWAVGRRTVDHGYDLYTKHNYSLIDSVMFGLSDVCETQRCSGTVGAYGVIDENGLPSLDGMIMRGSDNKIGAAANVKSVKEVTRVARAVFDYTKHTFMAGSDLDQFAADMGLNLTNLTNSATWQKHEAWKNRSCQNNHRMNVLPDPRSNCGPYRPDPDYRTGSGEVNLKEDEDFQVKDGEGNWNHDTVCMVGLDEQHRMVVATSTNGKGMKVPGRVADTPVPGAGGYADDDVGAAAATGNGDVMMRFLPSFQIVEAMRLLGMTPQQAAEYAIWRIARKAGPFNGALIAINKDGDHGGSCYGLNYMTYAVRTPQMPNATGVRRPCVTLDTYVPPPTINPPTMAPPCDQASPVVCSFTAVLMAFLVLFFTKFINVYD